MWDVPCDAIPHNLRFEANTPADRIIPGGARTFRFEMTENPVAQAPAFRPGDKPPGGLLIIRRRVA